MTKASTYSLILQVIDQGKVPPYGPQPQFGSCLEEHGPTSMGAYWGSLSAYGPPTWAHCGAAISLSASDYQACLFHKHS